MSAVFVAILNSLINPIVYCIRIREFRVALIEILKRYATAQVVEHWTMQHWTIQHRRSKREANEKKQLYECEQIKRQKL